MQHKTISGPMEIKSADSGQFRATIATLNVMDRDFDVTLPDAFKGGQRIKIASWGHDWSVPNVGVGVLGADAKQAWVDGQINLNVQAGRDIWEVLRFNGSLQEWSYGFQIEKSRDGTFGGHPVRFLELLECFEASPVFLGAGVGTGTSSMKRRPLTHQRRELLLMRAGLVERDIVRLRSEITQLEGLAADRDRFIAKGWLRR